ncbi:GMP synthase-like glutamine amidotransferase [Roseiarcus fermentans]|uniref:GMP synthase-like glutamine amidotransferase n=1 Tax=Roseiarcus fermentans TaxID=1473586 RepID=A0A366F0M2_9HYPH|nr:type 1 glutamine amidotransferase [Roseiarcus fermentans]RBP08191.1 GMP synthase-like glutamine amidotransferase [Roseiarcus fermentans]
MTIGILECGAPPEPLRARFGGYGAMVQRLLGPHRETAIVDVPGGALSAGTPDFDAYVVTGSAAGVYDDLPWIPGLIGFLRQVKGRAKLVGLCFGHQAMAEAFGGAVVKSPKGWGLGLQRYEARRRASWMDGAASVMVPALHQDQVVVRPPGARVTLASAFTPYAGLDYGDAVSFQFHPEFPAAFATALIEARRDRFGALADPAIASYGRPHDCARIGQWIGRFLDAPGALSQAGDV